MSRPQSRGGTGSWADRVCPRWGYSIFDIADRLGYSTRHAEELIRRYHVPHGMIKRRVLIAPGVIRTRRLRVFTPTALESLLAAHAGLNVPSTSTPLPRKGKR